MKKILISIMLSSLSLPIFANSCIGDRELLFLRDHPIALKNGVETYTDIYSIKANGKDEKRLTNGGLSKKKHDSTDPAWSPDGKHIVFVSNQNGDENPEIYRMNADGSKIKRLTKTKEKQYDEYPDWSSRGEIIFSTNRDGDDFQLYTMDTKGKLRGRLTKTEDKDFDARWSPNGQSYVFTRQSGDSYRVMIGHKGKKPPQALTPDWFSSSEATWTTDGKFIVFVSNGHAPSTSHFELYIMDAKDTDKDGIGDHLRRLTNTLKTFENTEPSMSKDGQCIAYVRAQSTNSDESEIRIMPVNGAKPLTLVDGYSPHWR